MTKAYPWVCVQRVLHASPPCPLFFPKLYSCLSPTICFLTRHFDRRTNKDKRVLLIQNKNKAENFTFTKINPRAYSSGHPCLAICCRLRVHTVGLACAYTFQHPLPCLHHVPLSDQAPFTEPSNRYGWVSDLTFVKIFTMMFI